MIYRVVLHYERDNRAIISAQILYCGVGSQTFYLKPNIDPKNIIGNVTTIRFKLTGLYEQDVWWTAVEGSRVDIYNNNPGKDVDVYFACNGKRY